MLYPLYAKHPDGSVWYQFFSDAHFEEYRRLGPDRHPLPSKYIHGNVKATDYSTRLYIRDLIEAIEQGNILRLSASEYDSEHNS